ncbi:MAG: Uncharacterised protein [Flavobacteriia bacterium]|nr:MAG: Uncharacterised protein [Flavobacteriia bacterium]
MSGELDLRNDLHSSFRCIKHHIAYFGLGIITAVDRPIGFRPISALLIQAWVAFDLYTPALILCQMPVQHVHLEERK